MLSDKSKGESKALKVNKLKIKHPKGKTVKKRKKNLGSNASLKTISEVSSNISNHQMGRSELRNMSYRTSSNSGHQSYTVQSKDSTREKLDQFYASSSPN